MLKSQPFKVYVYLPSNKVEGNRIANQTIDHYSTGIGLAGLFVMHDIPIVQLNIKSQSGGPDIIVQIGNQKYAIEYERPGSHNFKELVEKKEAIEKMGASPLFVCQHSNLNEVIEAVGVQNAVPRGCELIERLKEIIALKSGKVDL